MVKLVYYKSVPAARSVLARMFHRLEAGAKHARVIPMGRGGRHIVSEALEAKGGLETRSLWPTPTNRSSNTGKNLFGSEL